MTNNGAAKPDAVTLARDPVVLEDLLENGQGVGRIGGLVTFVTGGLPGERVRIAVDEVKKNYASAHAVAIEQRSIDRVEPHCPVFPRCGGCQTLHVRYAAELAWKRRLVADALSRLGGFAGIDVLEVVAAPGAEEGYRNKVALVQRWEHGRSRLGFFGARSHRLVGIDGCPVLLPRLQNVVQQLVAFAKDAPDVMRAAEHIVARSSATGSDIVVSFNGRAPNRALGAAVGDLRRRVPELTGLVSNWEPASANAVFGRRFATLWGAPIVRERVRGADFVFGVASFFQINTAMLELISARVIEALHGARRVVDLYAGVGTFAILLSKQGIATTGVESFKPAVDEAWANAAHNGVTNASFEHAAVKDALAGERGRTLLMGTDAVIVDPPRKGCEEEVLAALSTHAVPHVLYVSCNPATLARDGAILRGAGYRLDRVQPYDMFPHTGHVEVLAEFRRA